MTGGAAMYPTVSPAVFSLITIAASAFSPPGLAVVPDAAALDPVRFAAVVFAAAALDAEGLDAEVLGAAVLDAAGRDPVRPLAGFGVDDSASPLDSVCFDAAALEVVRFEAALFEAAVLGAGRFGASPSAAAGFDAVFRTAEVVEPPCFGAAALAAAALDADGREAAFFAGASDACRSAFWSGDDPFAEASTISAVLSGSSAEAGMAVTSLRYQSPPVRSPSDRGCVAP